MATLRPEIALAFGSPRSRIVGRDRELAAIRALLASVDVPFLTLTGPGGVGKTRLALAVAEQVAEDFDDHVVIVPLESVRTADLAGVAIAHALGVRNTGNSSLVDILSEQLRGRKHLLVLDNLEQILDLAQSLAAIVARCPELTVLATSRAPLHISSEREFLVQPLALPPVGACLTPNDLENVGAVDLFVRRAQAVDATFALTAKNAATVEAICRRLDGLPLAIELAAAKVNVLPPPALLDRLERRLPLLTGGPRDAPDRQRTMRDAISWSYELLTPELQEFFCQIGIFIGGFTLEGVESVSEDCERDVLDGIAALVSQNLLQLRGMVAGEPRYAMLEIIRDYALEQLDARGELQSVQPRHAAFILDLFERSRSAVWETSDQRWLDRLDAERANLQLSLAWMNNAEERVSLLRLCSAAGPFWHYRGYLKEGRVWLERALEMEPDLVEPTGVRADAWLLLGLIAQQQGCADRAIEALQSASQQRSELGDKHGVAEAQSLLAGVLLGEGNYDAASSAIEQALDIHLGRGKQALDWIAHARFHQGAIAFGRGDLALAEQYCTEAVKRFDEVGGRLDAIDPIRYLGLAACARGKLISAHQYMSDEVERLRERGSLAAIGHGLADIATLASYADDHETAARLFGACQSVCEAEGLFLSLPARDFYERTMARSRAVVGRTHFEALLNSGERLSAHQAEQELEETLRVLAETTAAKAEPDASGLTDRELEILRLLVAGKSNPEIATELFISRATVRTHVSNILGKLGVHSRTEAATEAHRRGLT